MTRQNESRTLRASHPRLMSYLKYVFVQQPCPKHSDALCADSSIVPTEQIHRLFLLAIQVEGHGLVLHTEGYPVPSETTPIF